MLDAYMYTGLRTPFGRHAGALARACGPTTCWPRSSPRSSSKSGFDPDKIEDVVVGCANQARRGQPLRRAPRGARRRAADRGRRARSCSAIAAAGSTPS